MLPALGPRVLWLQVYVQLRGMVDFDVEIKKLQKQVSSLAYFLTRRLFFFAWHFLLSLPYSRQRKFILYLVEILDRPVEILGPGQCVCQSRTRFREP